MERFQTLLTEILTQFGGVDLKAYRRENSQKTLWQEIGEVQKARNAVVHRGETVADSYADLGISVASAILTGIFPQVVTKLNLHLHDPLVVCGDHHSPFKQLSFDIENEQKTPPDSQSAPASTSRTSET